MSYDEAEAGTVWALTFEQYPGLTVRMRRPGFAAERLLVRAEAARADRTATPVKRMDALADTFTALADSMDSWTLTRKGTPVPTTRAGVLSSDARMLARIVAAWQAHVIAAPAASESTVDVPFDDRVLRGVPMEALADPDVETAQLVGPELAAVSGG